MKRILGNLFSPDHDSSVQSEEGRNSGDTSRALPGNLWTRHALHLPGIADQLLPTEVSS